MIAFQLISELFLVSIYAFDGRNRFLKRNLIKVCVVVLMSSKHRLFSVLFLSATRKKCKTN